MTVALEDERLLSPADAEKVLGIPASTVRSWYRRQRFTDLWHYGQDRRGHPMFKEGDLRRLRDKNRVKQRAPRQRSAQAGSGDGLAPPR